MSSIPDSDIIIYFTVSDHVKFARIKKRPMSGVDHIITFQDQARQKIRDLSPSILFTNNIDYVADILLLLLTTNTWIKFALTIAYKGYSKRQ